MSSDRGVVIVKHGPVPVAVHLVSPIAGPHLVKDLIEAFDHAVDLRGGHLAGYLVCLLSGNGHEIVVDVDRQEPEAQELPVVVVDTWDRQVRLFRASAYRDQKGHTRLLRNDLEPDVVWSFARFADSHPGPLTERYLALRSSVLPPPG